jgi:hypothetical protein
VHFITDDTRHSNARAASHGYGAGQIEAGKLIDGWSIEELDQRAHEVLDEVDQAQAYAQAAPTGYDDYVQRVTAEGGTPSEDARIVYQAGFDIGFSAALVEGCGVLLGHRARE